MACVELTTAADRAADRDHRERPECDSIRPEAGELHDVPPVTVAPVRPDLDPVADSRLEQGQVYGARADVGWQADVAKRVLACSTRPALEARERDDVGPGLRDPDADCADVRHDRHLDRDSYVGIRRLQLVDQLGEILDR